MIIRPRVIGAALFAVLVGGLFFFYDRYAKEQVLYSSTFLGKVGELENLEYRFDGETLQGTFFLYHDYDRISQTVGKIEKTLKELRAGFDREKYPETAKLVDRYEAAFLKKKEDIYLFQTVNSVIKNSALYIPSLSMKLYTREQHREPLYLYHMNAVAASVMMAKHSADTGFIEEIAPHVAFLESYPPHTEEEGKIITAFLRHVKVFVEYFPRYSEKIRNILDSEGKDLLASVKATFSSEHKNALAPITLLSLGLMALFIGSLAVILYLLYETDRENRLLTMLQTELRSMNENLEIRVSEELEKRRKHERYLMQQSKLAAMGEMLVSVSHHWRQPLNTLGLVLQDMRDAYEFGELDKPYLDDSVEKGMGMIQKMSKVINSFLSLSKPSLARAPFDVARAVREVRTIFKPQLEDKGVDFELYCAVPCEEGDLMSEGMESDFKQALVHLVENAAEAVEKRWEEEEARGRIRISLDTRENQVLIRIADNGGGIPEEAQEKIFDPYFSLRGDENREGMGLYLARTVVEEGMQGALSVKNKEGGAVFTVALPRHLMGEN